MEKHCVLLVNKCLIGEVPSYFKDYFMLRSQSDNQQRCTRQSLTSFARERAAQPPQSPRGFYPRQPLYYLATKTARLRRLCIPYHSVFRT